MIWFLIGLTFFLILIRIPVAFAIATPAFLYVLLDPGLSLTTLMQRMIGGVNSVTLLAVPVFILAGNLANAAGITDRLFDVAEAALGRIRGSLGYVNVVVSFIFSWMSGAAVADAAALGKLVVPNMVKRGYDERFSVGLTASSAMISPIMPPSVPAVVYGVAASVSIGGMFVAGIIPAMVLGVTLLAACYLYARRRPDLRSEPQGARAILRKGRAAFASLLTPVIILGGILSGLFTPTEAAAVASLYLFVLAVFYGKASRAMVVGVLRSTAQTSSAILLIVAAMGAFNFVLVREQVPEAVGVFIRDFTDSRIVFFILANLFLLLLGMFLEPLSAILLTAPILVPIAASYGIDPFHMGVVLIFNLLIGLITPPIGLVLYVMSSVKGIKVPEVVRGKLPFLIPLLIALLLITFIPEMSLYLPRRFGFVS
jgi:tripartite ATP-independent transporter DctM subunit